MKAIYRPCGKALEYAALACNLRRGCEHGCTYCWSPSVLRMSAEDFHASSRPRPGILEALRKEAPAYRGSEIPVLLSFTSDPYSPSEAKDETTREAISILREHDVPVHILTKGGMRASRDFPLLASDIQVNAYERSRPQNAFGTTLCWTDDADRLHWEPGAAPVADRILAIKLAHNLRIRTWVSVEPVIVPEQAIQLIGELSPWVDEFRAGKLNYHPTAAEVDWAKWAPRILAALQASGRDYLVKRSLRPYLLEGEEVERRVIAA